MLYRFLYGAFLVRSSFYFRDEVQRQAGSTHGGIVARNMISDPSGVSTRESLSSEIINATNSTTTIDETSAGGIEHYPKIDDAESLSILPEMAFASKDDNRNDLSRREWLRLGAVMVSGCVIGGTAVQKNLPTSTDAFHKALGPLNFDRIWDETSVNVTVQGPPFTWIALDPTTFQKKQTLKLPGWVPSFLMPPSRVIRGTSNYELLTASVLAGAVVEMARTSILYPLLTLKIRIQSDINTRRTKIKGGQRQLQLGTRFKLALLKARKHWQEGNLYAGLLPSLLITAPATGLFYGVRDVAKRALMYMFPNGIFGTDIPVVLTAAFLGDVAALMFRTPSDTLSIRLQTVTATTRVESRNATYQQGNESAVAHYQEEMIQSKVGDWLFQSVERLPAVILTDLPFLLSRIALNRLILSQRVDVGRYEIVVICVAVLCAFLTTPFDVARTRILVDSRLTDQGIDGGSGEGLVHTFRSVYNEGDGGIRNLFAGWLERTAYLGIGRACLEPLQIIGYLALRDAIILEWFD